MYMYMYIHVISFVSLPLQAEVNLARGDGNTALHAASWRGHEAVVAALLAAGAAVDPTAADAEGTSAMPLHFAARQV